MSDATPLLSNHVRQQDFAWKQIPPSGGTQCQYANKIEIEESEHDITLVFKREVMNKDLSIARVSVPRSLWEELVK